MIRLLTILFIAVFLSACEKEETSNAAPSIQGFRVNDLTQINSLMMMGNYDLSFEASDDKEVRNYQLLAHSESGLSTVLKEAPINSRVQTVKSTFEVPELASPGLYEIELKVFDSEGLSSSLKQNATITPERPILNIILPDGTLYEEGSDIRVTGEVRSTINLKNIAAVLTRDGYPNDTILSSNITNPISSGNIHTIENWVLNIPTGLTIDNYNLAFTAENVNGQKSIIVIVLAIYYP